MASLVSRIKEKVQPRSDITSSATASDRVNSGEQEATAAPTSDSSSHPDAYWSKPRVSLENSAFHVTSTGGVRKPLNGPQDPYQLAYANSNAKCQNRRIVSLGNHDSVPGQHGTENEPGRHGVLPISGGFHSRGISRDEQQAIVGDVVPERESSKHAVTGFPSRYDHESDHGRSFVPSRKPLNGEVIHGRRQPDFTTTTTTTTTSTVFRDDTCRDTGLPKERALQQNSDPGSSRQITDETEISGQRSASTRPATIRPVRPDSFPPDHILGRSAEHDGNGTSTREQETAHSKPLPQLPSTGQASDGHLATDAQVAEKYLSTAREKHNTEREKARAIKSGHLKLPQGFSLHDTEETHVTEEHRPAVVHETIIKQRTEIVQEAITRDIHVHHYYTYLQPIRVVEILPARHFFLDLQTGIKTEVLPPPDWQIPSNMQPVSPDTSMIKSTIRHYLVDEEHPNGVLEPPPLNHEESHENL